MILIYKFTYFQVKGKKVETISITVKISQIPQLWHKLVSFQHYPDLRTLPNRLKKSLLWVLERIS